MNHLPRMLQDSLRTVTDFIATFEPPRDDLSTPFVPESLRLLHGYVKNTLDRSFLLTVFGSLLAASLFISWNVLVKRSDNSMSVGAKWSLLWFLTCGFIHTFVEGGFALSHANLVSRSDIMAQMWKEYAKSDSRYLSSDSFVVPMETLTAAAWGPLSFVVAWMMSSPVSGVSNSPTRWMTQFLVSAGQLYGVYLYFATTAMDAWKHAVWEYQANGGDVANVGSQWWEWALFFENRHCIPHNFYYYFYYVFMNALWVVFPTAMALQAWTAITTSSNEKEVVTADISAAVITSSTVLMESPNVQEVVAELVNILPEDKPAVVSVETLITLPFNKITTGDEMEPGTPVAAKIPARSRSRARASSTRRRKEIPSSPIREKNKENTVLSDLAAGERRFMPQFQTPTRSRSATKKTNVPRLVDMNDVDDDSEPIVEESVMTLRSRRQRF